MKNDRYHRSVLTLCLMLMAAPLAQAQTAPLPPLPEPDAAARLWARWWWMGSTVTEDGLTQHLEAFQAAGLGGASIVPIYGVKGRAADAVLYLSERWTALFTHTLREAERLGLEVDMTLGTGWPYGGPWVPWTLAAQHYDPETGAGVPTGQRVKRSSPGGGGPVHDPFDVGALAAFLAPFDSIFADPAVPIEALRAVFNDSYEVFGANWTTRFLAQFEARRGYDLRPHLPLIFDEAAAQAADADTRARVLQDYHETLSDLLIDQFAAPWVAWVHARAAEARYQAHGAPANVLDLYAMADIPETEAFGASQFDIPGVRIEAGYDVERFGHPSVPVMKLASSAAHVAGRKRVSSETATWLGEHFRISLAQVKPQFDQLFLAGINHIFLHGIPYSPFEEAWPGWIFYASTHFGPSSQLWPDLPATAAYVARTQALLQAARPDHDVLVYFPIYDLWQTPGTSAHTHMIRVHGHESWLHGSFGEVTHHLLDQGYGFDYVSDRQVQALRTAPGGGVHAPGGTYRAIVVPAAKSMPVPTLRALTQLAEQGTPVVFLEGLPEEVPGLHEVGRRQAEAAALRNRLAPHMSAVGFDGMAAALAGAGVRREALFDLGLQALRKRTDEGHLYFVANLGRQFQEGTVPLAVAAASVEIIDPMTGRRGLTEAVQPRSDGTEVYLQLPPGLSVLLRTYDTPRTGPAWTYDRPAGTPVALEGTWTLSFEGGGPAPPPETQLDRLQSWTELGSDGRDFSGTGRYRLRFTLPSGFEAGRPAVLDLGEVREAARVKLNGRDLGTAWSVPFQVRVPDGVLQAENELEIDVRNLAANRIAALDRAGAGWKKFEDANVVNMDYEPFDASGWAPEPSGLLGPVRLIPVEAVEEP